MHDSPSWWCFTPPPSLRFHCLTTSFAAVHHDAEPSVYSAESEGFANSLIWYIKQMSRNPDSYRESFILFDQMRCCENEKFKFVPCAIYLMLFFLFSERFKTKTKDTDMYADAIRCMWCADKSDGTGVRTLLSQLAQSFFFGVENDVVLRDCFLA